MGRPGQGRLGLGNNPVWLVDLEGRQAGAMMIDGRDTRGQDTEIRHSRRGKTTYILGGMNPSQNISFVESYTGRGNANWPNGPRNRTL